jgi:hypothetical protein
MMTNPVAQIGITGIRRIFPEPEFFHKRKSTELLGDERARSASTRQVPCRKVHVCSLQ